MPNEHNPPGTPVGRSGTRVLLVEDNEVNRMVALRMLEFVGYAAEWVENGQEAVDLLEREFFDLILMDCQMPQMDGYEAVRIIRTRENSERRCVVVAMTANAHPEDRDRCLDAGMDDYLAKPIRIADLDQLIRKYFPQA